MNNTLSLFSLSLVIFGVELRDNNAIEERARGRDEGGERERREEGGGDECYH